MRIQSMQNYNQKQEVNFGMFLMEGKGNISHTQFLDLTKAAMDIAPNKRFTIDVTKAIGGLPGKIIVEPDRFQFGVEPVTRTGEYTLELALDAVRELAQNFTRNTQEIFTSPIKRIGTLGDAKPSFILKEPYENPIPKKPVFILKEPQESPIPKEPKNKPYW